MSSAEIIVRYDGPLLAGHRMDIEELAPAMLSLAELVKRANYVFNGDRASVRVLAAADVEQSCFTFGLEIVQDVLAMARGLLADEDVKTAKELADWIGLAAPAAGGGLFGVLRFLRGRKPDEVKLVVKDGQNVTQINAGGDVYIANPMAATLLRDKESVRRAKNVTKPLLRDGYETLEFRDRREPSLLAITKEEAKLIETMPEPEAPAVQILQGGKMRVWVGIRKAAYAGTAKWTIQHDRSREVAMNDLQWLEKFQTNQVSAPPGSQLDVDIEIGEIRLDKDGKSISEPEYSIEKVYAVRLPQKPAELF